MALKSKYSTLTSKFGTMFEKNHSKQHTGTLWASNMNRELREGRQRRRAWNTIVEPCRAIRLASCTELKGTRQAGIPHRHSSASFPHASSKRDLQHGREIAIRHSDSQWHDFTFDRGLNNLQCCKEKGPRMCSCVSQQLSFRCDLNVLTRP